MAVVDIRKLRILQISVQIATLIAGLAAPLLFFTGSAAAAQLTSRSVSISTSKVSATGVTYTYSFTTPATTNIGSIALQACTTPLNTCTSPGGTIVMNAGTEASRSGWTGSNTFVTGSAAGCTPAANMLCITRTAQSETAGARTLGWNTQTNPTAVASYYIRITTYSDAAWVTSVDTGVVAYAIVNELTLNARIQEILNFCVGTTAVNDATTTTGTDCTAITGTTVDIGVLDTTAVNTSPVSTNGGSNTNGVAMIRTNAQSGAVITYFTLQDNSSGTLKVVGAACGSIVPGSGSTTDQCINSSATKATFTAGTENFGMTIGGVNCGSTTSYTCTFASGLTNLAPNSNYVGGAYTQGTSGTYGVTAGFAWNSTTTATTIASSASSPTKVIDDEALILRFAATPQITTPTGAYTTTSIYIATATY